MGQSAGTNQAFGSRERRVKARERKTEIRQRRREGKTTMITKVAVTETKRPQILADGEVYAVRVGDKYFSYFDENGRTFVSNIEHCVTKPEADEIAKKV